MICFSKVKEKSLTFCRWFAMIAGIAAPISTAVTSVACVLLLLAWLISGEVLHSLRLSARQPAGKMLLVFFVWLIISAFYANTSWADKLHTFLSWKTLVFTFILFGLFHQEYWQRLFVKSYLLIMSISALAALFLWSADISVMPGRDPGIFMSNYISQSMAFIAATACCLFLLARPMSIKKKCFLGAAIVLFAFNIFFVSEARSGYIAYPFAIVCATSCAYGVKNIPKTLGYIFCIIIIALISSQNLQQRISKGLTEKATYNESKELTSIGLRIIYAKNTMELIKERPMLGYGTSSFKSVYGSHVAQKYSDWKRDPTTDPHNQYLFVWLENGFLGLGLFCGYIVVALRQGISYRPYGAIAASLLVAYCISSLFSSHFKTFPEGHLLAFFVGILLTRPDSACQKCT